MSEIWYIYKVTDGSGRGYVGVTKRTVLARWKQHVKDATAGVNTALYYAIRTDCAERARRDFIPAGMAKDG